MGSQQHDLPAGVAVRLSEPRPHHDHADQCICGRQHQRRTAFRWTRASIFTAPSTRSACTRPIRSRWANLAFTASGRYNRTSHRQYRSSAAGDGWIARIAQRPKCFRSLQSGGRRHVHRFALRDCRTSATAKAAARRPPSNWVAPIPTSPAICPMRWSAIRRSSRWSPGHSKPVCAARWKTTCAGAWAGSAEKTTTIFCSWHPSRPASAISLNFGQTRRQGVEVKHQRPDSSISPSEAITRFWTQPIKAPRRLTAAAIAPMMEVWEWTATLRCSPATAFRRFPGISSRRIVEYQPTTKISVDLDFDAVGRSFARGNENNLDQPDGMLLPRTRVFPRLRSREPRSALPGAKADCSFSSRSTTCSITATTRPRSLAPSPLRQ